MSVPLRVYGSRLSPYVARVWLQTLAKGLSQIEFAAVPGGLGSPDYRRLNPIGKIPLLDDEGTLLPESEIICEYLEERFPTPPLLPADPVARSQVRLISRCVDLYVLPPLSGILPQSRRPAADQDRGLIEENWQKIRKGLTSLEAFLGAGPFALAGSFTLADCALVPAAFMLYRTLPTMGIARPFDGYPKLDAWWANIQQDAVCKPALAWMATEAEEFRRRRMAEEAARAAASARP